MSLQRLLADAAVAIVGVLIAIGLGYWWGAAATEDAWKARETKAAEQQLRDNQAEAARSRQAATDHLAKQRSMEERYAALELAHQDLLRRHPLVVAQRGGCGAALRPGLAPVGGGLVASAQPGAAPAGEPDASAPGRVELPDDGGDGDEPRLTLAAVRVWNGSLLGADAPAGACGAAGASEGADAACASDSGLTLAEAWANHHTNAQACAEDRQRYRDLIEYLTRSPQPER